MHQPHQHGFRLVKRVVGQSKNLSAGFTHCFFKRRIPHLTRLGFQAAASGHLNILDPQRNCKALQQSGKPIRLIISPGAQMMVDVNAVHLKAFILL